jgi:hypothetical protein
VQRADEAEVAGLLAQERRLLVYHCVGG